MNRRNFNFYKRLANHQRMKQPFADEWGTIHNDLSQPHREPRKTSSIKQLPYATWARPATTAVNGTTSPQPAAPNCMRIRAQQMICSDLSKVSTHAFLMSGLEFWMDKLIPQQTRTHVQTDTHLHAHTHAPKHEKHEGRAVQRTGGDDRPPVNERE